MMGKSDTSKKSVKLCAVAVENPLDRKITKRQATYFATETGLNIDKLVDARVGDLAEELRWRIDPSLWFYQRVCGRIVKTDPVTGEKRGVPFATVHVEDTDCSFIGLFPVEHPHFWWMWPTRCDRETIATVTTDECGYFCVNIPKWDIDRLLQWRKKRVCFPEIFRPRIPDLLERFPDIDLGNLDPVDPPPWEMVLGDRFANIEVPPVSGQRGFGDWIPEGEGLDVPIGRITPPVDAAMLKRGQALLGNNDQLPARDLAIGPFLRCRDIIVPEWKTFYDVPDITFKVTQDVDSDGEEEIIYTEGYFDVRWNDTAIGPVELEASAIARATISCDLPEVSCTESSAFVAVGMMPTAVPYLESNGYAKKVNRPRVGGDNPGGAFNGDAESPFTGELQLSACYHSVAGAAYFRVIDTFDTIEEVITGVSWTAPSSLSPGWVRMIPDVDGWYPVVEARKQINEHLVMSWPVPGRSQGAHSVRLELADASKNHLTFSQPLPVVVDDRRPDAALLSVIWREESSSGWNSVNELVGKICPVISRSPGRSIEVRVVWSGGGDHFRNTALAVRGCSSGPVPTHQSGSGGDAIISGNAVRRWYEVPAESGLTRTDVYSIGAGYPQGAYEFVVHTRSRAFEPAGAAGPADDWETERSDRYRRAVLRYAVVDAI